VIGLALIAFGQAIRVWAAGSINKCLEISAGGPFGCVRNPLYIGSFFIMLGYCAMGNHMLVTIAAMFLFCIFHGAAIICEERYLVSLFGSQFEAYCKSVPRLLPKWLRHGKQDGFSFSQALNNKEHVSALFAGVVALAFAMKLIFQF
jgi:protein-S-isoprenylcysteine O-methyltransferase Ste14